MDMDMDMFATEMETGKMRKRMNASIYEGMDFVAVFANIIVKETLPFNPSLHMPILGSSNSATNKGLMS